MEQIQYALRVVGAVVIVIIITRIYMSIAYWVGEEFGVGEFCRGVWQKIRRKG